MVDKLVLIFMYMENYNEHFVTVDSELVTFFIFFQLLIFSNYNQTTINPTNQIIINQVNEHTTCTQV